MDEVYEEVLQIFDEMDESGNSIVFDDYVIPTLKRMRKLCNGSMMISKMFDEIRDRYNVNFFSFKKDGKYLKLEIGRNLEKNQMLIIWNVFKTLLGVKGFHLHRNMYVNKSIEKNCKVNEDNSIDILGKHLDEGEVNVKRKIKKSEWYS